MGIIVSEVAGKYFSTMMFDDKNLGNICSMISTSRPRRKSSNLISASSGGINKLSKIDQ